MKLCIVLTSRGNYAKFKKIIELAQANPKIELSTVVGGELVLQDRTTGFFDFPCTRRVYFDIQGDSLAVKSKSIGYAINEFTNAFSELKPDYVMLVGDRYETFAAATAAYMSDIPVIHLEGGEISGTLDNRLRYAISELSEIHFPCTKNSAQNLKKFQRVYCVGSTSLDVLETNGTDFAKLSNISGIGCTIRPELETILVIYHPDTKNLGETESEVKGLIDAIDSLKIQTIWLNANMDAGSGLVGHLLRQYNETKRPGFVHFFKSLPIEYYSPLLANTACIVGNSSSGIREAGFFGTPNVTIGKRQHCRELCMNTMRSDTYSLKKHITYQVEHGKYAPDYTYGDGTASEKIMEILEGGQWLK